MTRSRACVALQQSRAGIAKLAVNDMIGLFFSSSTFTVHHVLFGACVHLVSD